MALSKQDRDEIIDIIKLTVNGKIDGLSARMDTHIKETQPYIQAASGFKIIYKFIIVIAGFLVALDQIMDFGIIKNILSQIRG